jgi:hypothetical protein
MKIVEEGMMAPTSEVIHLRRSNQTVNTRIVDTVRSHNQEYSSLSFLLRTSSMMSSSSPMLTVRATILFRIGITSSSTRSTARTPPFKASWKARLRVNLEQARLQAGEPKVHFSLIKVTKMDRSILKT